MMLESATARTFAPHIGEVFTILVSEDVALDSTLVQVREAEWAFSPEEKRTPFSLYFQSRDQRVFPQRIYQLQHPVLGELEIFLVPTARNGEGVLYEAVFN
jgi:hypothetical protein